MQVSFYVCDIEANAPGLKTIRISCIVHHVTTHTRISDRFLSFLLGFAAGFLCSPDGASSDPPGAGPSSWSSVISLSWNQENICKSSQSLIEQFRIKRHSKPQIVASSKTQQNQLKNAGTDLSIDTRASLKYILNINVYAQKWRSKEVYISFSLKWT